MVKHVLKNGTVLHDIKGHKPKQQDVPLAYEILKNGGRKNEKGS